MELLRRSKKSPLFIVVIVWLLFSFPFFLGKTPYPSDYQVNYFSPFAQYPTLKGPVKNNAQPDIIGQIYPWKFFTIHEIKKGNIPFWNPYSFSGTPHLSNYQTAVFSPFNLLYLLPIPFLTVWGLIVVLQPLLAGIFTYLFARSIKTSKSGALVSSLSFMFCGFIVTWMGYATLPYAIIPLPLALFAIEKYSESKKFIFQILLSFTFPLSFFSGHFQTSLYFLLGVVLYILYRSIFSSSKKQYVTLVWFIVCGLLLCSPQLLPSIELYLQSVRSIMFQKNEAIPLQYITTVLSPDYFGNPVTRNDWFGHYAEWSSYAGSIVFILALLGILRKKIAIRKFFMLLAILSILLAYDTPLLSILVFLKVPVLSTSAASRIIVLFSFSVAMLAGLGFDQLWERVIAKKRNILFLAVSLGTLFAVVLLIPFLFGLPQEKVSIAIKNSIIPLLSFVIFSACVILGGLYKRKTILLQSILVILVTFEMLRFATKWQSFSSSNNVYPSVPVTNFFNGLNHVDRAVGLSGAEDSLYYRVPILTGYDPLYIGKYGEFMTYAALGKKESPGRSVVGFPTSGIYSQQIIDMMGVRYIFHKVSDKNYAWAFPFYNYPKNKFQKIYDDNVYQVFENTSFQERAYLVSEVVKTNKEQFFEKTFQTNLRSEAVVVDAIGELDEKATGSAIISKYEPSRIEVNVDSTGRQLLVISDSYYKGWKATVNGMKANIVEVNGIMRGVVVPKGQSKLVFSYFPESFMNGIYLFLVGILGIIIVKILKSFQHA